MATYIARVETDWTQKQAFEYLADFSSVAEWDPGVPRAECVQGPPLQQGARFDVDVKVPTGTSTFTYETIEIDAPNKVVLKATENVMTSLDTLTFEQLGSGKTLVTYQAELTLKGPLGLADPLLKIGFNKVAAKAEKGLAERLADAPPAS